MLVPARSNSFVAHGMVQGKPNEHTTKIRDHIIKRMLPQSLEVVDHGEVEPGRIDGLNQIAAQKFGAPY